MEEKNCYSCGYLLCETIKQTNIIPGATIYSCVSGLPHYIQVVKLDCTCINWTSKEEERIANKDW